MDFMRILQSLEEFLYEAMTWIIFYPRTIFRTVRNPVAIAIYTRRELSQARDSQFGELISPPLVLILTVIIARVIDVVSSGRVDSSYPGNSPIGKELFSSDQSVVVTRCLVYCMFALFGSITWLRHRSKALSRENLRLPFYIHCYILAPFMLGVSTSISIGTDAEPGWGWYCAPLTIVSVIWFVSAQCSIYSRLLDVSRRRAFWLACRSDGLSVLAITAFGFLL
jgi:hypothetical protein